MWCAAQCLNPLEFGAGDLGDLMAAATKQLRLNPLEFGAGDLGGFQRWQRQLTGLNPLEFGAGDLGRLAQHRVKGLAS